MLLKQILQNHKSLVNQNYLTEKVRLICMKGGLENITRTALTELSFGLIEMFQNALTEMIHASRQQRSFGFITNTKKSVLEQGQTKQINV